MNQQRPLVPDGNASASSIHAEMDYKPNLPIPQLPQRKKKPGPKRDSKPAPSEKLERNRQAQRTHRERKEQYTKELELEVLRLKELFVGACRERDSAYHLRDEALRERDHLRETNQILHEENQRMREVIQASSSSSGTDSGYEGTAVSRDATRNSSFSAPTDTFPGMLAPVSMQQSLIPNGLPNEVRRESVWEISESRGFASDEVLQAKPIIKVENVEQSPNRKASNAAMTAISRQLPAISIDYDELGLDFVLTLERPCMGHIQYLHVRAHNYQSSADGEMAGQPLEVPDDGENQHISGHALMATAPPYSHIMETPGTRYPTQYPTDLKREDLLKLLDLSSQLAVDERELPPVKAWLKIMQDGRLGLFSVNDLQLLKQTLLNKVHCYRFGAVIDDNDIEEAMHYVMEAKNSNTVAPPPASACIMPTVADTDAPLPGSAHSHAHAVDARRPSLQYSISGSVPPGTAF